MIRITKPQAEEMTEHAKSSLPYEACGILAGRESEVTKIYPMTNTSDNPETCYFMDPEEQFKVMKEMRQLGIEMLGIYHSHPESPPYPSATDCELAFYPDVDHVIVSLQGIDSPEIKAFKIVEGDIREEDIQVSKT